MLKKMIGDMLTINGMRHIVEDVDFTKNGTPVYYFKRSFDASHWYAVTPYPNRFTKLHRIADKRHQHMDDNSIYSTAYYLNYSD